MRRTGYIIIGTAALTIGCLMLGCTPGRVQSVTPSPEKISEKTIAVSETKPKPLDHDDAGDATRPISDTGIIYNQSAGNAKVYDYMLFGGQNIDQMVKYSYVVPHFNLEGTDDINARIDKKYTPILERELQRQNDGEEPTVVSIVYNVTEYKDIVSVIIEIRYANDERELESYVFNCASNKELTPSQILSYVGYDEEALKETIKLDINQYFIDDFPNPTASQIQRKQKALQSIDDLSCMLCISQKGNLIVGVPRVTDKGILILLCELQLV